MRAFIIINIVLLLGGCFALQNDIERNLENDKNSNFENVAFECQTVSKERLNGYSRLQEKEAEEKSF